MKGKINEKGMLCIERTGVMIEMSCPGSDGCECMHFCPHFGEPDTSSLMNRVEGLHITQLQICQNRTLLFTEFTDERKKNLASDSE